MQFPTTYTYNRFARQSESELRSETTHNAISSCPRHRLLPFIWQPRFLFCVFLRAHPHPKRPLMTAVPTIMPHQPIESPFPLPPAPNNHSVDMQHPMRMPSHNTNSTTLPGSSAAGHFGSPAGLGAPPSYYGGYPDAMGGPIGGAACLNGMPGGGAMRHGMGAGMAPAGQPSSIINLANSSDVVIGPMTQYQGSVTIYQYMDATFDAAQQQPPNVGGVRRGAVRSDGIYCNHFDWKSLTNAMRSTV